MSTRFIDKYEIISTLGRGSMGVVYKALDPEIGRTVAIKTMKSVFMGDDPAGREALQRFRLESRSAGRLHHPNIVTIFEAGRTENGSPFIVMEFIEGRSLELIISENGPLEPSAVLHYLAQIAGAIDYAHSQSVIHRDIKPSNILIDNQHRAHLLDFGVAKLSDSSLTPAGTVVGTPSYMSPEQIRGAKLDGRTDLFSLAVVAFECLTGVRPFPGNDFTTVVSSIIHKQPLSIVEIREDLPSGVEAALQRGLAKDREQRLPDALSFINDLAQSFGIVIDGQGIAGGYSPADSWAGTSEKVEHTQGQSQSSGVSASATGPSVQFENPQMPLPYNTETDGFERDENEPGLSSAPSGIETIATEPQQYFNPPLGPGGKGKKPAVAAGVGAAALLGLGFFGFHYANSWSPLSPAPATGEGTGTEITAPGDSTTGTTTPENIGSVAHVEAIFSGKIDRESLEKMNDSELRGVLISPNAEPEDLVLALEEVGRRTTLSFMPMLHSLLEHSHFKVRISVLRLFDKSELLDRPEVVSNLLKCLSDKDNLVRGYAAKILGGADRDEVRAALALRAEVETDSVVQRVLQQSLNRLQIE